MLSYKFDYQAVGASFDQTIQHTYRMYSLDKIYAGQGQLPRGQFIITPKLDGAAVSILYCEGNLVLALTRGDGKSGLDITNKLKTLVPNKISRKQLTQITGQVVAPSSIPNSRNYASGSLGLDDIQQFKTRQLTFVAYGVQPHSHQLWSQQVKSLEGFTTVFSANLQQFPTDGIVYRIDNYQQFNSKGYTAKHPKGAFALKQRKAGVATKLLDVVWQVGRTGVVSPVAILQPVIIGQAKVSRATLHNKAFIQQKQLQIGCIVQVVRSGEIIPKINRRIIYEQ